MFGSLMIIAGMAALCVCAYGVGKLNGYDQWEKENEACTK